MTGKSLPLETVRGVLDDARAAGVNTVRYYGGEPLVHPDLPAKISHAKNLGLDAYVTTNGTLLERRIDDLYEAGLRWMTIGFYGGGSKYDEYTQRRGQFDKLRAGIKKIRDRYGSKIEIKISYVLLRQTCTLEALNEAWSFAREYGEMVKEGPEKNGFYCGIWTCAMIEELIFVKYGVRYNPRYLSTFLKKMGLSYQKAKFIPAKCDEEDYIATRKKWLEITWPKILKKAKKENAIILFGDEVSFAMWGSLGSNRSTTRGKNQGMS